MIKPRLTKGKRVKGWFCNGKGPDEEHYIGYGETPNEAYQQWLSFSNWYKVFR